jgi:uncharacterized protein YceH (UPF0502 family)
MNPADDNLLLDAAEVRVLGALVEKAVTTPDYYPLSLNALVNACNQSSNRDPVVSYGEPTVLRAVESLRDKKLAFVFEGATSRVAKYGQKLADTLSLSAAQTAALTILMLRGPQTVGEIRSRSGRLHEFAGLDDAEATLQSLAARSPLPLVQRLPRQSGFKESRYAHLLAGPAEVAPAETAAVIPPHAGTGLPDDTRIARLEGEVEELRLEYAALKTEFADFRKQLE